MMERYQLAGPAPDKRVRAISGGRRTKGRRRQNGSRTEGLGNKKGGAQTSRIYCCWATKIANVCSEIVIRTICRGMHLTPPLTFNTGNAFAKRCASWTSMAFKLLLSLRKPI